VVVAVAITLLPLAVLAVQAFAHGRSAPLGDQALLELRVHDVGGAHTPLVGSYQKFGWNQPGPALLYLLAAPYRLLGSDYAALQIGAVLLNALAVAGTVLVAWRRGGTLLALWTMALLGVLLHGRGPTVLADPWEPSLSVLALVLLLFVATDVALGRAWSIPIVIGLASVIAQAWATTAVMAGALVVWAVVAYAAGWWRDGPVAAPEGRAPPWRAPVLVAVGVLAVLWLPPLVEEVRGDPGNVTAMWRFFTASHETFGLLPALRTVGIELGPRAPWLGFDVPLRPFLTVVDDHAGVVVPIAFLALLAGGGFAAWRRDRSLSWAFGVLVLIGAGTLALSRLVGEPFIEVVEPTTVYGFGCWFAAGWCAMAATRARARVRVELVMVPVLVLAVVGLGVANTVAAAGGPASPTRNEHAVAVLAARSVPAARGAPGPVLVRSEVEGSDVLLGTIGPQLLALMLARAGVDVRVDADRGHQYGSFRAHPEEARTEMLLTYASAAPRGDGWRRVATIDPLPARVRAHADRLDVRIAAGFGPVTDQQDRLRVLSRRPELRRLVRERSRIEGTAPLTISMRSVGPGSPDR